MGSFRLPVNQYEVIERVFTEVSKRRALTPEETDILDIAIRAQQASRTSLGGHTRGISDYERRVRKEAVQHAML